METETQKLVALLKAQLSNVTGRLAQREKELAYFRTQVEAVQADHANLCKLVSTLKASASQDENTLLRQQNEQLARDFDILERRVSEVASVHLLDNEERELMTVELERLHEENERKNSDRQRTIEIYEERLRKLRTQLKNSELEAQQLRMETDVLREEVADHYNCLEVRQQLQDEMKTLRDEYEEIVAQLDPGVSDPTSDQEKTEFSIKEEKESALGSEQENLQLKEEVESLRERLQEREAERSLWQKALQHAILTCAPVSRKAEAQKLAEELNIRGADVDFLSQTPQLISDVFKESPKSPKSTTARQAPSPRVFAQPKTEKRKTEVRLRVVAKVQKLEKEDSADLFQTLESRQIKFIGGSKEAERSFQADAVCQEDEEIMGEVQNFLSEDDTAPLLIIGEGAAESEIGEILKKTVETSVQFLLNSNEDVYFSVSEVGESESFPGVKPGSLALQTSKVKSVEQVTALLVKTDSSANVHLVVSLHTEPDRRRVSIVQLSSDESTGQEVLCKVLSALYAQRYHVPFRNSLLTTYLQELLQPNLHLLALLSIHQTAIEESLKVLQFGNLLIAQREAAISRQRALALNLQGHSARKQSQIYAKSGIDRTSSEDNSD